MSRFGWLDIDPSNASDEFALAASSVGAWSLGLRYGGIQIDLKLFDILAGVNNRFCLVLHGVRISPRVSHLYLAFAEPGLRIRLQETWLAMSKSCAATNSQ